MQRVAERGLLVTSLGVGLTAAALVAVARSDPAEGEAAVRFVNVLSVWCQVGAAAVLCHLLLCFKRPGADQILLPVSLALTGLGIGIIFSLDPGQAQKQVGWLWCSLALFAATLLGPSPARLREYKYLFGLGTILLLILPMIIGREINGARLWIQFGGFTFQPGELAKVTLVIFLAGYLASRGELLVAERWRLGPLNLPQPQFLAPVALMWALAMALLVLLRDLGTALLFFGTFIAVIYLATGKPGYLLTGGISFAGGAWAAMRMFGHVRQRLQIWLDPWSRAETSGYQILQGLFAIAAGGIGGTGLGVGSAHRIPAATTDYPFAALCEELGLWGAAVIVALVLIWLARAFRLALLARDPFLRLLAGGIGCLLATQTLVILGGVTKLIPLTGITLPFISYGGSSLLTNYLLLGLLLRCSESER